MYSYILHAGTSLEHVSLGLYYGLVNVLMSSWGHGMSVYMVVANNLHHASNVLCGGLG